MELQQRNRRRSGQKLIAYGSSRYPVSASMSSSGTDKWTGHMYIGLVDPNDENRYFNLVMTPDEAIEIGKALLERGQEYKTELLIRNGEITSAIMALIGGDGPKSQGEIQKATGVDAEHIMDALGTLRDTNQLEIHIVPGSTTRYRIPVEKLEDEDDKPAVPSDRVRLKESVHPFVATPAGGPCSSCGRRRSHSIHDYKG